MVLLDHFTFDFAASHQTFQVTGGSGRYKGAKGTVSVTTVGTSGNDSDIVIKLR
jgi:hypothetical protein